MSNNEKPPAEAGGNINVVVLLMAPSIHTQALISKNPRPRSGVL